jgi:hypothetical protein
MAPWFMLLTALFQVDLKETPAVVPVGPAPAIDFAEGEDPDLSMAADGTLHVVYVRQRMVYYRRQLPGAPAEPEIELGPGEDPVVAAGSAGEVHVVATSDRTGGSRPGNRAALLHAYGHDGKLLALSVLVADGRCRKPRVAIDAGGGAVVSYEDRSLTETGGQGVRCLWLATDGTLRQALNVGPTDNGGLALDVTGTRHLTWRRRRDRTIYHTAISPTGRMSDAVAISPPASDFSDLTADLADGSLHVVAVVAAGKGLYYLERTVDGRWLEPREFTFSEVVNLGEADNVNPDIAVDGSGRRFIVFTGENHWPFYFIIDAAGRADPVTRVDPAGGATGGKYRNPHVVADPKGGAWVAWGADGRVRLRKIH